MRDEVVFVIDPFESADVRALVARHLATMHASSPPGSVHALDVDSLLRPNVTFWSAWIGDVLAGCCALKDLGNARGEIKSMHVADAFRGRGIGRKIVDHLVREARVRKMTSLWLETGSSPPFAAALGLYESAGFRRCGPFDGYSEDPFSLFMTREL